MTDHTAEFLDAVREMLRAHGGGDNPAKFLELLGRHNLSLVRTETLSETEAATRQATAGTGSEPMWCVFEQMGRSRYPCRLTVEEMAGIEVLRLDVPDGDGWVTTIVRPGTMYAIRPCSEEVVRRIAAYTGPPEPAHPWELKAVEAAKPAPDDAWHPAYDSGDDYGDEDGD